MSGNVVQASKHDPLPLAVYDAMCRAIAAAYQVDEVKDVRDRALALETYARLAKNTEAETKACEILRAERRVGQLLATMQKARGAAAPGRGKPPLPRSDAAATLAELGISKPQSSRWQKLAEVPEEKFEESFAEGSRPSTAGIIAASQPPGAFDPGPKCQATTSTKSCWKCRCQWQMRLLSSPAEFSGG